MTGINTKLKNAVVNNIGFSSNNTVFRVDDDECYNSVVMLHGNVIAKRYLNILTLDNCGYVTNVTSARLNAILAAFCYDIKAINKDGETLFVNSVGDILAKNKIKLTLTLKNFDNEGVN